MWTTSDWEKKLASSYAEALAPTAWLAVERARLLTGLLDRGLCRAEAQQESRRLLDATVQREHDSLMEAVMQAALTGPLAAKVSKDARVIVDVGLGHGDFAARLLPAALERGFKYVGVDISDTARQITSVRLREAGIRPEDIDLRNVSAEALGESAGGPFAARSVWLVVWGRLGLHLKDDSVWLAALAQAKEVLRPDGYFLLFEPLQDLCGPRENDHTKIKAVAEYCQVLAPLKVVTFRQFEFCRENYGILLWRRP